MMNYMDFNCFSGNWPFYKVRYNTVEKLAAQHKRIGVTGGVISSLEAIFYQDPYEAELALAKELEGTDYLHAMILNPRLPGWKDDLHRAQRDLNIKAVRLVPGFQGYTLADPVLEEVAADLRMYGLPVILTLRMRDERTMWMLQPENVSMEDLQGFLDKYPDIPTVVTHIRAAEAEKLSPQFVARENLFVDISGFKDGLFVLDRMATESAARGHLVYGSGAPLMEMQATTLQIDTAQIPEEVKTEIFGGEKLLAYLPK